MVLAITYGGHSDKKYKLVKINTILKALNLKYSFKPVFLKCSVLGDNLLNLSYFNFI